MTARPTVAVIGAGPAALACAHRLRAEPGIRVVMIAPEGRADYLPGALAVATGDSALDRFRRPVAIGGVEVVPAIAEGIEPGRVRVDGSDLEVQAVVAAPGLALEPLDPALGPAAGPRGGKRAARVVAFWDLDGAAAAAPAIEALERGILTVVIASPLYRCPPAPYGLAIRLARRAERLGRPVRVRLTTPEPRPLVAIGSEVGEYLAGACAEAGVEVEFDVQPDPAALAAGQVTDHAGQAVPTDLAVVVPPHRSHPLVAGLAGGEPLVAVDTRGRTATEGIYVAGDAAAGPYPRAVAPAVLSGLAAAEGALADLGFGVDAEDGASSPTPELDCFVDRGGGLYGRIQVRYPGGPPPAGRPEVEIDGSGPAETVGFDAALRRWRAVCSERASPLA